MSLSDTQRDIIKGLILTHINVLWDFTDQNSELLSKVLIKISDDSISSAEFRKYTEDLKGIEDYFISTLRQLRKLAFPSEDSVAALNEQYTNLKISLFDLKSSYSTIISELLKQLEDGSSHLSLSMEEACVGQKVSLINEFLQINIETVQNTHELKKEITVESLIKMERIEEQSGMVIIEESKSEPKNPIIQAIRTLIETYSKAHSHEEKKEVNASLRSLVYKTNPKEVVLNFSHLNLSDFDLSNLNLHNADFSHAKLNKTNFCGANLANADLSNANMIGCEVDQETHFENNKLAKAKLDRQALEVIAEQARQAEIKISLSQIDASHQDLSGLDLSDLDFTESNFNDSDFTDSDVSDSDFTDADLRGTKNLRLSTAKSELGDVKTETRKTASNNFFKDHEPNKAELTQA